MYVESKTRALVAHARHAPVFVLICNLHNAHRQLAVGGRSGHLGGYGSCGRVVLRGLHKEGALDCVLHRPTLRSTSVSACSRQLSSSGGFHAQHLTLNVCDGPQAVSAACAHAFWPFCLVWHPDDLG